MNLFFSTDNFLLIILNIELKYSKTVNKQLIFNFLKDLATVHNTYCEQINQLFALNLLQTVYII